MKKTKKIAYSGSHGTGKTTEVFQACSNMKMKGKNVGIVSEIARESPLPINRGAPIESQLWIVTKQIEAEIRIGTVYPTIVCDRTVVDCCAYCFFIDRKLFDATYPLCKFFINTYDLIYFKLIKNNDYLISDGVRDMDKQYQQDVEDKMLEIYKSLKCNWIEYL